MVEVSVFQVMDLCFMHDGRIAVVIPQPILGYDLAF
jgi:hypothetical protein